MPQPYLPTFKDKRYHVGFNGLKARPKFQAAIGRIITLWSYVDNELGGLFGVLLKTDSEAAYRVFLVLRRWSNQRQALDAAAQAALTGDELLTYRALIVEYGSLEAQRNNVAHGCFGNCPDDDDLLFMVKIEHHVIWQAEILPRLIAGKIVPDPHQGLIENMWVYRMSDLERLENQMEQLWWDMFHFNSYLRQPNAPGRAAEFRTLYDSPRIQQRIATHSS